MSASSPSASSKSTALLLLGVASFQAGLAAGLPWGRIAYGGRHAGRLPDNYRRISAVAAPTFALAAAFVASDKGSRSTRRGVLSTLSAYLIVGAGVNLASGSPYERLIWTPYCAATALSAWRARPL